MKLSSVPSATLNSFSAARPAQVQSVSTTAIVARLQERFKTALLNIATQRKEIYEIILDLKEHFHEYGFKSAAAATTTVCQRSKSWANKFVGEIEAELEISDEVANLGATTADSKATSQEATLKIVAKLADPMTEEEEDKPAVHSADEKKREEEKPRSNGKPVSCHHVWHELEEWLGKCLNRADEANRVSPNPGKHALLLGVIKQGMELTRQWKSMA